MNARHLGAALPSTALIVLVTLVGKLGSTASTPSSAVLSPPAAIPDTPLPATAVPTPTAAVVLVLFLSVPAASGQLVNDVVSEETAPEGRAPYGDSCEINRLERPFTRDIPTSPTLMLTRTLSAVIRRGGTL